MAASSAEVVAMDPSCALRDKLTGALIGLARATEGNEFMLTDATFRVVIDALRCTDRDEAALTVLLERADAEKRKLVPDCYHCTASCGRTDNYDLARLQVAPEEIRALKLRILSGVRDLAAAYGDSPIFRENTVHSLFYRALYAIGMEDWTEEELLPILRELDKLKTKASNP